jgi:hypothetical protein
MNNILSTEPRPFPLLTKLIDQRGNGGAIDNALDYLSGPDNIAFSKVSRATHALITARQEEQPLTDPIAKFKLQQIALNAYLFPLPLVKAMGLITRKYPQLFREDNGEYINVSLGMMTAPIVYFTSEFVADDGERLNRSGVALALAYKNLRIRDIFPEHLLEMAIKRYGENRVFEFSSFVITIHQRYLEKNERWTLNNSEANRFELGDYYSAKGINRNWDSPLMRELKILVSGGSLFKRYRGSQELFDVALLTQRQLEFVQKEEQE